MPLNVAGTAIGFVGVTAYLIGNMGANWVMPILANVLIRQQGEAVTFTGTDMEIQVRTQASIGAGSGTTATTVSAKKLIDILRALPDTDVTIELNGNKLNLKTTRSRFALQTLPSEDFPVMKAGATDQAGPGSGSAGDGNTADLRADVTLSQKKLRHLLQMVHFAMAQQDIRFYLNGLLLVLSPAGMRAVATEGHRLAFCEDVEVHAAGQADAILPRKSVLERLRLLGDSDEAVRMEIIGTQVRLRFGDIEFISKLWFSILHASLLSTQWACWAAARPRTIPRRSWPCWPPACMTR